MNKTQIDKANKIIKEIEELEYFSICLNKINTKNILSFKMKSFWSFLSGYDEYEIKTPKIMISKLLDSLNEIHQELTNELDQL